VLNSLQETTKTAMENMNDIVWSINPNNDKFIATIDRLEIFANEILNAKGIKLHFSISEEIKDQKLSMQQRKNIYLICKEAINNIAKYSEANNCTIEIRNENRDITIRITDDGKGIDQTTRTLGGNGIINMKKRTSELKGMLDIFSEKNMGTSLSLRFML
jgi:signal transduction histidine kinase